jgi:hypothetical protein
MDHPRGGGDGDVDGHRYKLNPSGIAAIYARRADGGVQHKYAVKTKAGESIESLEARLRA